MHIEDFINGMTDKEFDMWYDDDATNKQRAVADKIIDREELPEDNVPVEVSNEPSRNSLVNRFVSSFRRLFQ